jgi:hypothetical protein
VFCHLFYVTQQGSSWQSCTEAIAPCGTAQGPPGLSFDEHANGSGPARIIASMLQGVCLSGLVSVRRTTVKQLFQPRSSHLHTHVERVKFVCHQQSAVLISTQPSAAPADCIAVVRLKLLCYPHAEGANKSAVGEPSNSATEA